MSAPWAGLRLPASRTFFQAQIDAAKEIQAYWFKRYKAGEEDVVFPYGTFRMRVRHGVRVADPPS